MADGLCTGETVGNLIEKALVKNYENVIERENNDSVNDVECEKVKSFYISSDSDKLFDNLCSVKGSKHEGFLQMDLTCSPTDEDCRKKRCADRYDSSESSDSGVAINCTDCSGSSTASSDITDPGSPFSTASNNSEDSALQSSSSSTTSSTTKMPPTQTVHSPWPWSVGEAPPVKRALIDKVDFPKRIQINRGRPEVDLKMTESVKTVCPVIKNRPTAGALVPPTVNSLSTKETKFTNKRHIPVTSISKTQQGKITEYFKSQMKTNGLRRKHVPIKSIETKNAKKKCTRSGFQESGLMGSSSPIKKQTSSTQPRKILPAPSKVQCDNIAMNTVNNFAPTVTLTALTIQPSLTYIHTKTPKPPDNYFLPQFATINNDKLNTIPLMSATPCINTAVIPPLQKITTVNSFNCFKLNATVVPIVKLNTLPSKVNGSNITYVDAGGMPTVPVPPKPPTVGDCINISNEHQNIFNPDSAGLLNMYQISAQISSHTSQTNHHCSSEEQKLNPFEVPNVLQPTKADECLQTQFEDEANFLVADEAEDIYNIKEKEPNICCSKSEELDNITIKAQQACRTKTTSVVQTKNKAVESSHSSNNNILSNCSDSSGISSISNNNHNHLLHHESLSDIRAVISEHCQFGERHEIGKKEEKCRDKGPKDDCEIIKKKNSIVDNGGEVSCIKKLLEVSVNETVTVKCQKSPILSQPKTIRFPVRQQKSKPETKEIRSASAASSSDISLCRWAGCDTTFDTSGALLEHLQIKHVISQATQETYVCLWNGCKVHGRTSCSRSWLERHVLAHAGNKPFRCIVEGCGIRFNSQISLERHVNNHFSSDGSQNGTARKTVENGSAKLFRRNGKKIRFRRQPWSARMFDFFDSGIMEGLQDRLMKMTEKRTLGQIEGVSGDSVVLQSQVLAKRVQKDGQNQVLVKWHPSNIIPDEWINECEYKPRKSVSIRSLSSPSVDKLNSILFPSFHQDLQKEMTQQQVRVKHSRKPKKNST